MPKAQALDIGLEYTTVALASDEGFISLKAAATEQAHRTPTAMAYDNKNVRRLIGAPATRDLRAQLCNPKNLLSLQEKVPFGGFDHAPEDLLFHFLNYMCGGGEEADAAQTPTALVVPYELEYADRQRVLGVARRAHLHPLLVNIGDAAALGYELDGRTLPPRSLALVVDLGAGAIRLAVLEVAADNHELGLELVTSGTLPGLGATLVSVAEKIGLPMPASGQLVWQTPDLPRILAAAVEDVSEGGGQSVQHETDVLELPGALARRELQPRLLELQEAIRELLAEADIAPENLDFVLPAGGGANLKVVINDTLSMFGRPLTPPPGTGYGDVCARGAARLAYFQTTQASQQRIAHRQLPYLGLELDDGQFDRGLLLEPSASDSSRRVYEAPPRLRQVDLRFCQGLARRARACTELSGGGMTIACQDDEAIFTVEYQRTRPDQITVQAGGETRLLRL